MGAMHLGGWQRIAVVASAIWFMGAAYVSRQTDLRRAASAGTLAVHLCEGSTRPLDWAPRCNPEFSRAWYQELEGSWIAALFYGLAPLPLFCGIGYSIRGIVRWVRRGFQ